MERKLHEEPYFDMDTLAEKCRAWKADGASKVTLEWSSGTGPNVFYFPAGERGQGVKWTIAVETYNYNEMYADFVEHTLIPRLKSAIAENGLGLTVMCVDLQPLQIQRQRRRQIERAQTAATGDHTSGHH